MVKIQFIFNLSLYFYMINIVLQVLLKTLLLYKILQCINSIQLDSFPVRNGWLNRDWAVGLSIGLLFKLDLIVSRRSLSKVGWKDTG